APGHAAGFEKLRCHRLYGLVPAGLPVGARARLALQATIGPMISKAPDPRGPRAAVTVHWCQPPWSPPAGDGTALERKRRAYWHNDKRNDHVAAAARAFGAGDLNQLWERGLLLRDADSIIAVPGGGAPAVAVLVESVEHGRELLRRPPRPHQGWSPAGPHAGA